MRRKTEMGSKFETERKRQTGPTEKSEADTLTAEDVGGTINGIKKKKGGKKRRDKTGKSATSRQRKIESLRRTRCARKESPWTKWGKACLVFCLKNRRGGYGKKDDTSSSANLQCFTTQILGCKNTDTFFFKTKGIQIDGQAE